MAQDQKSLAQGTTLQEAPEIADPNAPPEEAADTSSAGGLPGMPGAAEGDKMMSMEGMPGMGQAGMEMGPGGYMGGMGPGQQTGPQKFMILESPNPDQAFIVPIHLAVYVEQDRIPDLLVEFQNSPMNIEVLEFSMQKPKPHSVEKPEKGKAPQSFGMGMESMMGMMPGMGMMGEMMEGGYGGGMGMPGMAQMMMGQMPGMDSMPGMNSMPGMEGMMPGMEGMAGRQGGAASVAKKKGVSVRDESLRKIEEAKKAKSGEGETTATSKSAGDDGAADPYYNVVKVEVFGRARFYLPPPQEETPQSEAETAEGEATPGAEGEAAPAGEANPATPAEGETKAEAPQDQAGDAKPAVPPEGPKEEPAPQEPAEAQPAAPNEATAPTGDESADSPK